jgi:hypothetical protein
MFPVDSFRTPAQRRRRAILVYGTVAGLSVAALLIFLAVVPLESSTVIYQLTDLCTGGGVPPACSDGGISFSTRAGAVVSVGWQFRPAVFSNATQEKQSVRSALCLGGTYLGGGADAGFDVPGEFGFVVFESPGGTITCVFSSTEGGNATVNVTLASPAI